MAMAISSDLAAAADRADLAAAVHQEKERKGRQQQNHAQVVAEPEREDGVEDGQPADSGPIGPRHERQAGSAHDQQVQRVDLGGDGLRPEGVGKGEKQARAASRR